MKILLAEDDQEIRPLLKAILEGAGHTCVTAEDGLAAKEVLEKENDFQVLISDFPYR